MNDAPMDIQGWARDVIETLIRATDDEGRKVPLDHATRRKVLECALAKNDAMEADMKPGGAFHDFMAGIVGKVH